MKTFPDKLRPENRSKFASYKFNRDLCKLRARVYEYVVSGDTKGFDLREDSENKSMYSSEHIDDELVNTICEELENDLGWKTKLAYGKTVLFIYDKEDELPSIPDMEEIDS